MKKTTLLFAASLVSGYTMAQPVPSNPRAIELSLSGPAPGYATSLPQGGQGLVTIQAVNAGYGGAMPLSTFSIDISVDPAEIPFDFSNGPVYDTTSNGGKWRIINQTPGWIKLRNTNGTIAPNEPIYIELKVKVPANAPITSGIAALNVSVTGGMGNLAQNTIATPQDDHMDASIPITPSGAPLHVTYSSFSVVKQSNAAFLQWSTSSEINNNRFEIERSSDGSTFTHLASVAGAGNSQSLRKYNLIDDKVLNGINYYRIKQVDRDGKSLYSEVKKADFSLNSKLVIHPNPATDLLTIDGLSGGEQVMIYNSIGQKLIEMTAKASAATVQVNSLLPGNYTVVVYKDGQRITSKQFVKM